MWDPETKTMTLEHDDKLNLNIVAGWESDISRIANGIESLVKEIHENERKAHDDRIRFVRAIENFNKTFKGGMR